MGKNPGIADGEQYTFGVPVPTPVSSSFCVPYVTQVLVESKVLTLSSGKYTIKDVHGKLVFQVESKFDLSTKRVLRDSKGTAIVLLKQKIMSMDDRWEVYRGESLDELLFTLKSSSKKKSPFQIFVASNTSMKSPDFVLREGSSKHSYSVFHKDNPLAEVSKKRNFSSLLLSKDQYDAKVFPGVDQAFISSIVVIVDQVKNMPGASDAVMGVVDAVTSVLTG